MSRDNSSAAYLKRRQQEATASALRAVVEKLSADLLASNDGQPLVHPDEDESAALNRLLEEAQKERAKFSHIRPEEDEDSTPPKPVADTTDKRVVRVHVPRRKRNRQP